MFDAAAYVLPTVAPARGVLFDEQLPMGDLQSALPVYSSPGGWVPGRVLAVEGGAMELQALLDEMLQPLVVVAWHAGWVGTCRDTVQPLQGLAKRFPDIAFLQVDIQANPRYVTPNDAAAWDMVLTKPEARRQDAMPVLRNYAKFPAFTLHMPPTLQPWTQLLTGPEAVEQLRAAAGAASSGVAPELPEGKLLVSDAAEDADEVTPPASEAAASEQLPSPAAATADAAAVSGDTAKHGGDAAAPEPPQTVTETRTAAKALAGPQTLTGGPGGLKAILESARDGGATVLLLWYSSGGTQGVSPVTCDKLGELMREAERLSLEQPGLRVYLADVGASKANWVLANALKVGEGPVCHIYRNMKLVRRVAASEKLAAAVSSEAVSTTAGAAHGGRVSFAAEGPGAPQAGPSAAGSSSTMDARKETAAGPSQEAEAVPEAAEVSPWDPPPREEHGKAGDTRTFPQGLGHYWPRMPCLRCGCPWWMGEDWDARCARCGWDCEEEGYDDDSHPLPALKSTWQRFTAAVRRGKTPAWHGETLENKCAACP